MRYRDHVFAEVFPISPAGSVVTAQPIAEDGYTLGEEFTYSALDTGYRQACSEQDSLGTCSPAVGYDAATLTTRRHTTSHASALSNFDTKYKGERP